MREDIKSMTLEELRGAMAALGQPAFRAGQIYTCLLYTSDAADE